MQKLFLRILAGLLAFIIGAFAVYLFWFVSIPLPLQEVDPVRNVEITDCAVSATFPGRSREIQNLKKGKSGYFPKDDFSGPRGDRDDFFNDWYGKHLKAMAEGSLLDETEKQTEIFRFLWLRSFHHPIYVRVERRESGVWLSTGELDGAGGYEPGKLIRNQQLTLSQQEWCELSRLLEKVDYWNLPTSQSNQNGVDGAEWILEGVKADRYHVVDRWSPKGEYREACVYLLKLSGVDIDSLESNLY